MANKKHKKRHAIDKENSLTASSMREIFPDEITQPGIIREPAKPMITENTPDPEEQVVVADPVISSAPVSEHENVEEPDAAGIGLDREFETEPVLFEEDVIDPASQEAEESEDMIEEYEDFSGVYEDEEIPEGASELYEEEIPERTSELYEEEIPEGTSELYEEEAPEETSELYEEEASEETSELYEEEIPEEVSNTAYEYEYPQNQGYYGYGQQEYPDGMQAPYNGQMIPPVPPVYYDDYPVPEMPKKKKFRWGHFIIWTIAIAFVIYGVWNVLHLVPKEKNDVDSLLEETIDLHPETDPPETVEPETEAIEITGNPVPKPEIDRQLIPKNPYSRPGKKVTSINKIVVHYLANPKTTAQQNHDYFASLKDLKDESMSANYIVGLEGEIVECVPPGEMAYASNEMNEYSVSVENCHIDESGRFMQQTYDSDVHLVAWLVCRYDLGRDDIIRHYDVTGKDCPIYYVENEDKWEQFKDDVMAYIEACKADRIKEARAALKEAQAEKNAEEKAE